MIASSASIVGDLGVLPLTAVKFVIGRAFVARTDAKKDLAAMDRGWLTLRFPGRDINRDADALAQRVYDAVIGGAE